MTDTLLIRNGTVVDGTGLPRFEADVEVVDGRIRRIGKDLIADDGATIIDASGLLVTPGFVDIHTHYDAQLQFEPTASPSSWHGVTTVFVGNCGFSLAPANEGDVDWLLQMLSRVEGMSIEALRAGVDFTGGSVGDFLGRLDNRIGVNVAVFAGHCALRRMVMGSSASERSATDDEIDQMKDLLRQSLQEGAVGFSTSQLEIHRDHEGRPVPANLATDDELIALAGVLREFSHGVIEFLSRSCGDGYSSDDRALLTAMASVSGKPMDLGTLGRRPGSLDAWREALGFITEAQQAGLRLYPMYKSNPKGMYFTLADTFVFDEIVSFRKVLVSPAEQRARSLRDESVRASIRQEMDLDIPRMHAFNWDFVRLVSSKHRPDLAGRTVGSIATEHGVHPIDTLLDLAVDDDLTTLFVSERPVDAASIAATIEVMSHTGSMAGASDGGAHLQTFCGADYPTLLIGQSDSLALSLESAIAQLTMIPSMAHGLWDRGVLREGAAGDILVIDLAALQASEPRFVNDLPAGAGRLVIDACGYRHIIVNGTPLMEDGVWTGALPGTALRFGSRT